MKTARSTFFLAGAALMLLTLVPPSPGQEGATERVKRPGEPLPDRTTDAAEAPEVLETCGAERFAEFDRPSRSDRAWRRETVTFAVQFKDEVSPYRVMSLFVLPGETVQLEAVFGDRDSRFTACASGGELKRRDGDEWSWTAPAERGVHHLYLADVAAGETMRLSAFVMRPYAGETSLDGYRIGSYERVPLRNNPAYAVPRGMIEVADEDLDTWLSPHFQLRQFVCKQASDGRRYAIVGERLLLKLELLLEKVNDAGIEADTFAVLSAYRTPWYNASIGNRTKYSRHLYGDAADIYVDNDGDGRMDDLDGDGTAGDLGDAEVLAEVVESSIDKAWYRPFIGGLGLYGPAPHRGPFIHVDTRGFRARW